MGSYLQIIEVSQKQAYVFGSRKLRDNLLRSEEIRYVTSVEYFQTFPGLFDVKKNLVNSGGGHTVLEFENLKCAKKFASALTEDVIRQFPEIELFVKTMAYDPGRSIKENMQELTKQLETKKARRRASFHLRSFGLLSECVSENASTLEVPEETAPEGWRLTTDGEELAGDDNFLAIVHIDGNGMGRRVDTVYNGYAEDWDLCKEALQQFSQEIDCHYKEAFQEMTSELGKRLKALGWNPSERKFPVRRVIGAGDDVCFITAGSLGLDCAASMLQHLQQKNNTIDEIGYYSACAGVVLVHKKYPFHAAYELSEELCSNAKRFGTEIDPDGRISAIDWHIEFGQLKDSLSTIRKEDYRTDDCALLNLRPYAVLPENSYKVPNERTFQFFRTILRELQTQERTLPRSKIKALRESMKQGEAETVLALRNLSMGKLLQLGKRPFWNDGKDKRCLFFDAIEIMDHAALWRIP